MRVAVFTNRFPGPVSTFFARDMRGLIDAGVDIDVFAIYPYEPAFWRYVPSVLDEKILPRNKIHHLSNMECLTGLRPWSFAKTVDFLKETLGIEASAIRYGVEPFMKSTYVALKAWTWAQRFGGRFDHVLAYWGNYAATCAYLFQRAACPQVPFSTFLHAKIDLYTNQVYLREKLLHATNIIVVCEFNRQYLREQFPEIFPSIANKIQLHHLGLDLDKMPFDPANRPSRKVIAVGRLEAQKGFEYLLEAIRELKNRKVDVELELVGDGTLAGSLRRLANQLGVSAQVNFRGWLHIDDVQVAMTQATVLCHPSPSIGDAVPTVIKEAMALGTPVIGSRVAGIPELLDDGRCGILVEPKNVKQLADAIEVMLEKEMLRRQYTELARNRAEEKFDLWKNGQMLAAILTGGIARAR